jgi:RNA polymerase sigma-70 factor (ECF subfamily)
VLDVNSYPLNEGKIAELTSQERALICRAAKGDADAFGDLYEQYIGIIFGYIYYRVGDMGLAEDLTETVFLKVWESLSSFDEHRISFKGWLFRVAHNLLVDYYRTRKESEILDEDLDLPDPGLLPEEILINAEQQERIFQAMRKLKTEYQEILTLRFINGLSHEEAARVLNRSVGAVRVLQHRALQSLDHQLQKRKRDQRETGSGTHPGRLP